MAQPVRPSQPPGPASPFPDLGHGAESPDVELVEDTQPLVRARMQKSRWTVGHYIKAGVIVAVVAGMIVTAIILRERFMPDEGGAGATGPMQNFDGKIRNARNVDEKVFRLALERGKWRLDDGIKSGLKAIIAVQRSEPDAWLAVAAKDYGTQKPRKAELIKEAKDRLENHFGETLELGEKADDQDFVGERAQRLEFKGELKQVVWRGECFMFPHHGIGYWVFMAAPTLEEAQQEMIEIQKDKRGFILADSRSGWRPQPPKTIPYRGSKLPFTVHVPEEVWEKHKADDFDERGELFLFGRYLKEKDNRKNASVLVVALDAQPSMKQALLSARSYFEERIKEEDKDNTIIPVSEKADDLGVTAEIGSRPGRMIELKIQRGTQPTRYLLIAVTQAGEKLLAFRCQSTWESRQIWRQDFIDLLSSFQVRKN